MFLPETVDAHPSCVPQQYARGGVSPGELVSTKSDRHGLKRTRGTSRMTWRPFFWTPVGLQNGAFEECFGCKCLRSLVDLVRFELTTSSMPSKKYQSLTDSLAQNKRLSGRRRGLRWTPREAWRVRTPRGAGTWRAFLRARLRAAPFVVCRKRQQSVSI